jgi:hypothetical protein
MSNTAINAQGSTVTIETTAIKNIISFSGLDGEASEIDVTNLSSTAKEFKLGLKDFGAFSMEIHPDYDDAGQELLRNAGTAVKAFVVTLPNEKTLSFKGLVKNADSISGGIDGVINGTVSIKITGPVT